MRPTFKRQTNPLESSVEAIENNRNYLNEELSRRLFAVLPNNMQIAVELIEANRGTIQVEQLERIQAVVPNSVENEAPAADLSLEAMLSRLGRLVRNLEAETTKSGSSTGDIKATITAAKDLFGLVAKHGQAIEAEKKLDILRKSIISTLRDFPEEATKRFMKSWETGIKEATEGRS